MYLLPLYLQHYDHFRSLFLLPLGQKYSEIISVMKFKHRIYNDTLTYYDQLFFCMPGLRFTIRILLFLGYYLLIIRVITVVCSSEPLPSNSAVRVPIPAGSGILMSILKLWVSFVLSLAEALTFCWTHSKRPALVLLSNVLVLNVRLPYRHLTHKGISLDEGGG